MPSLEILSNIASQAKPTPILLIHGAWHGAWCWKDNFVKFFDWRDYSTYALSLRGHGKSEGGNPRFATVAQYLADIWAVTEQITREEGQHPILIGHSMGGYLVQKYLETQAAPAAVLLAPLPVMGSLPFFLRYMVKHPATFFLSLVTLNNYPLVATPERARELFFSPDFPADQLRAIHPYLCNESSLVSLESASVNLPRPSKINPKKVPMLVLGAEKDAFFSPREIEATARAYHTQATIYPNMAHNMMAERGWQAVTQQISTWLDEVIP